MEDSDRHKILVVDEDVLKVLELEEVLKGTEYAVAHLTSPSAFWAKLDYEKPDLLLIDISMRLFDHSEVFEKLRNGEDYEDMAVIIFSDRTAEEMQQFCVEQDINGYFSKSQDITQFPEFLENFF